MNPQPNTLHDRITALATYRVHHANMGLCPEGPDDPSRDPDCEVCGWLAETATAQPEADAVERVISEFRECVRYERDGTSVLVPVADLRVAYRALAAAQPVECTRRHLVPVDESRDEWGDAAAQPVEPEPDICDGSGRCQAAHHVHGCYADTGSCEAPDEHPPVEPEPQSLVRALAEEAWAREPGGRPPAWVLRGVRDVLAEVQASVEPEPFMPGPGHAAFCGNEQPHARHRHPLPDSYDVCEGVPPVEPEPDERALWALIEQTVADWHVREIDGVEQPTLVDRLTHVLAAGFRRSRPEATHTVTSADVVSARTSAVRIADVPSLAWCIAFLAALGVTVADTPTQAGDDA